MTLPNAIIAAKSANLRHPRHWFRGPSGLRAGPRLLIFAAILLPLLVGRKLLLAQFVSASENPILFHTGRNGLRFLALLFASWLMSRLEKKPVGEYGLRCRFAFRGQFWQGMAIGFLSLSLLIGLQFILGVASFERSPLRLGELLHYALLHALLFMAIGFSEEYYYRGYAQSTLASGIGFWPAALLGTAAFTYHHWSNPGETWIGLLNVAFFGLFFCLLLKNTGNLWLPVGLHTAWDWGQTFFFGVPNSGLILPGQLLNTQVSGPAWLTGGSAGPEGSWLCTLLLIALWFGLAPRLHSATPVSSAAPCSANP